MAAIRAREWETETYWRNRIARYMSGEQSPQHALAGRAVFVAVDEADVVGFVAGHRTRRYGCDGELEWINVVHEKRGEGVAGRLMAAIADWLAEQGAARICVNVEPGNTAARRLYRRYCAQKLNDYWMIWEDGFLPPSTDLHPPASPSDTPCQSSPS